MLESTTVLKIEIMSTKEQRSKLIQCLEEYFANTSEEQLKKDLEELEQYNQCGPDIEECLELSRQHCIETMKEMDIGQQLQT